MHERGLMEDLVARIVEEARARGAVAVACIRVEIGPFSFVSPEALAGAFEQLAEDTLLEGAQLEFVSHPGDFRCRACGRICSATDLRADEADIHPIPVCLACGSMLDLEGARGLILRELLLVLPESESKEKDETPMGAS